MKNLNFNNMVCIFICVSLCGGFANAGKLQELGKRTENKKTVKGKILARVKFLREEIESPTPTYQGFGGKITHDYIIAQIPKGLCNVYRESPKALSYMRKIYLDTDNRKIKKVLACAIAQCDDKGRMKKELEKQLMQILSSKDEFGLNVKAEAIHGLRELGSYQCIPELISLMEQVPKDDASSSYVISAANVALKDWGVETKVMGRYEKIDSYKIEPNRESAIQVLKEKIQEKEGQRSLELIEALSKLDKEAAINVLQQRLKEKPDSSKLQQQTQKMLKRLQEQ